MAQKLEDKRKGVYSSKKKNGKGNGKRKGQKEEWQKKKGRIAKEEVV